MTNHRQVTLDVGLGDIEIMHYNYCSKRHCDYCYIALEHFAAVNNAEHRPTSVSWVKIITTNINTIIEQEYIGFSIIPDVVHSILQYPTAIFCNILHMRYILLTCKNVCNIIIAWT